MHVGYSIDGETTTRAFYAYWNDGMAFATLSEDKEEPKWTSKKRPDVLQMQESQPLLHQM